MKYNYLSYLLLTIIVFQKVYSQQNSLEIIDLTQLEIETSNRTSKESDIIKNNNFIIETLFNPYKNFWTNYVGGEDEFIKWYQTDMIGFKSKNINTKKLNNKLRKIKNNISYTVGYEPVGFWYIIYGPAWTDLGGLSDGTMLIDLTHKNNSSIKHIIKFFPHELSHQIYSNQNKFNDTIALKSIIDEGLAVYINQLYWRNKYSLAENLGYSESELKECIKNEKLITEFFHANKLSTDKEIINQFRSRNFSILPKKLPGAIGYYIGYNIVKNYVRKNGENSWKKIYTESPLSVYNSSL